MATNLNIDQNLLNEAMRLRKTKTKGETINLALEEFIRRRKQKSILPYFGTIDFDESYNHKIWRKR